MTELLVAPWIVSPLASVAGSMSVDVPEPELRPDDIVARAVALRQHLRDDQAKTEVRSRYSEETHALFTEAGFYRMPRVC